MLGIPTSRVILFFAVVGATGMFASLANAAQVREDPGLTGAVRFSSGDEVGSVAVAALSSMPPPALARRPEPPVFGKPTPADVGLSAESAMRPSRMPNSDSVGWPSPERIAPEIVGPPTPTTTIPPLHISED